MINPKLTYNDSRMRTFIGEFNTFVVIHIATL